MSDRVFTKASKRILRSVDFLSLRDKKSQEYADKSGLSYVPAIDTAFALSPEGDIPLKYSYLRDCKYVVFAPYELNRWHPNFKRYTSDDFMRLYKDILNSLTKRGYYVVMMPQLFGVPERDQLYFEAISDGYFKNDVTIISDVYDSDVQQNIIREAQLVIGARYHTIVFAINNQIPFLALSYEHKIYDMLRILN